MKVNVEFESPIKNEVMEYSINELWNMPMITYTSDIDILSRYTIMDITVDIDGRGEKVHKHLGVVCADDTGSLDGTDIRQLIKECPHIKYVMFISKYQEYDKHAIIV